MKKTFEYRAYPTTKQRKIFTVWLALLRSVYNQALAWRIEAYETAGLTVKWTTQANALPDLKQESESFADVFTATFSKMPCVVWIKHTKHSSVVSKRVMNRASRASKAKDGIDRRLSATWQSD